MNASQNNDIPGPAGGAVWEVQTNTIWGEFKILIEHPKTLKQNDELKSLTIDVINNLYLGTDDDDRWM